MSIKCLSLQLLANEYSEASEERLCQLTDSIYEYAFDSFKDGDIDETDAICTKTLDLINQIQGAIKCKYRINGLMSNVRHRQGSFKDSLRHGLTGAEQALSAGKLRIAAALYGNCGALLFNLGDLSGAYRKQLLVLNISRSNDLKPVEGRALVNISLIFHKRREFADALDKLEEARIIFEELSDMGGVAYVLSAIALVKSSQGLVNESIDYYRKSLSIRTKQDDSRELLLSLINLSGELINENKIEEAEQLCLRALEITSDSSWPNLKALTLSNMIKILLNKGDLDRAIEIIPEVRRICSSSEGYEEIASNLIFLESRALEAGGQFKKAYWALRKHLETRDKLFSNEKDEEISNMRIASEVEANLREKEVIMEKNAQLSVTNEHLRDAMNHIKHLSGMLPICPSCKRIRDDDGYWQQVDSYISSHSAAQFKHSFCADCMEKLYPDLSDADEMFNGEQG